MIAARSLVFVAIFYLWSLIAGLAMIPLLLAPRGWMLGAMKLWGRGVLAILGPTCGVKVEFRGLEHLPTGTALIGAKHQCMFDTMGPFVILPDACYVMKKELTRIPFYGWFCAKVDMIVVDREGGSTALRKLLTDGKASLAAGRQLVIYPEGTRVAPGETGEYHPGIAALYRAEGLACIPLATNSGTHWPAHGFIRRPGVLVYEFLEPIPPGLPRAEFMRILEERLETGSRALLGE